MSASFFGEDPSPGPSSPRPPSAGPPKISLFFPSSAHIFALFFALWGSSRGILVFFSTAGTLKCPPFKRAHFKGHHQNTTRKAPDRKKSENGGFLKMESRDQILTFVRVPTTAHPRVCGRPSWAIHKTSQGREQALSCHSLSHLSCTGPSQQCGRDWCRVGSFCVP